ncbi:integrase catalytic domain-containing protein [Trichonephila clavipes]|nr:integrase catalytic domain-containing protein [Trichonephila clavipes]
MSTILCDAESFLNTRPLTYIPENPNELIALSPSVFLQEVREVEVSDLDYIDSKKLKKRFIYKQKILQDFRLRFKNEYLGQLKDFSKVRKASSIKEGHIVLVREEPTPSVAYGHSTGEMSTIPDPVSTKTDHRDALVQRSRYDRTLKPTKT